MARDGRGGLGLGGRVDPPAAPGPARGPPPPAPAPPPPAGASPPPRRSRPTAAAPGGRPRPRAPAASSASPRSASAAPASLATPPAALAAGGFTVRTNPTRDREEADGLMKQLRSRGYDATLVRVVRDGDAMYRVEVGRFTPAQQASEMMHCLRGHA